MPQIKGNPDEIIRQLRAAGADITVHGERATNSGRRVRAILIGRSPYEINEISSKTLDVTCCIETPNTTNGGATYRTVMRTKKHQKDLISNALYWCGWHPGSGPWRVTLTRQSAGRVDKRNLDSCLKWVFDTVAVYLLDGKPGEMDDDPRIEWRTDQATAPRGHQSVRIRIEKLEAVA
jgi:hypothetical protein